MIGSQKRAILETALPSHGLFILEWTHELIRNGDVHFPFRASSDMLLLTEVSSPDMLLVWAKSDTHTHWTIYSDPISETEQIWGSSRLDHDEIARLSGITDIRPMRAWTRDRKTLISDAHHIYTNLTRSIPREKCADFDALMRPLRMIKSREEIEKIREAIRVTKLAHDHIRTVIEPWMYEYEVEAEIARIFRAHHMTEAYPSIVASWPRACTLHYTRHDRKIEAWDLLLVDAWAEYHGYAADITRVFALPPWERRMSRSDRRIGASGFSPRQRDVYESVVRVKEYAESLIRPWVEKPEYERKVREATNRELRYLWLIWEHTSHEEREIFSRKYYPHSTSHFLGLDVHDIGSREEILAPGMIITCEPGIYIREEGIGIRLEDDILVTESGCENLSKGIAL